MKVTITTPNGTMVTRGDRAVANRLVTTLSEMLDGKAPIVDRIRVTVEPDGRETLGGPGHDRAIERLR